MSTLQAAAFGTVTPLLSGKVLIEASSGGVTTRYELPPAAAGMPPVIVGAMLSRMLDRYDAAVAALATAGNATPTDAQVLAQMLTQLQAIWAYSTDHSQPFIRT